MKKLLFSFLAGLLYLAFAPTPVLAFDSFGFYCNPYSKTFEEGKHYIPTNTTATSSGQCWFEVPSSLTTTGQDIGIAAYKGTVGNAQFLFGTILPPFYPINTAYNHLGAGFTTYTPEGAPIFPAQENNFFVVAYVLGSWDATAGTPTIGASNNNYQIINWKWGSKPPNEWDPVVIIPGILGSWEKNGMWILDPLAHTYDNLINTLKANGYVENKTLFTLPYDWEQSNVVTAQLLKQKIEQIKSTCSCSKVDIVAHSMGGLVATHYIMSDGYGDDIDQLFMLGTPIAGAPKAYKTWESGEVDFAKPEANLILSRIFSREAKDGSYGSVFEYIRNKPILSIKELLPVYQNYLKQGSTFLQYPTGYPQNPFLENLIGNPTNYYEKVIKKVQTYVVTGNLNGASTPIGYVIKPSTQLPKWEHGEIVSTINGGGDGTVPFDNAVYFSGPEKEFQNTEHSLIASSSASYVFSQLTGSSVTTLVGKNYSPVFDTDWVLVAEKTFPIPQEYPELLKLIKDYIFLSSGISQNILFIKLYSPVDMQITAPDGKKLGKDFITGANFNEIPNAVYSGPIGEHEYVLIENPLPGQYKVETIGTGNGTYTIAAGRIDAATTSTSLVSGTTSLNQVISNTLFYSSTSTAVVLTPPTPPVATSTPTTTPVTPETCVRDITDAYKLKWIGKKAVYEKLIFDCKAMGELLRARQAAKTKLAINLINTAIKLTLADMDLLAKDRANTKDAVLLITKITTWFRNHELNLHQ